jgi:hypothetical protein
MATLIVACWAATAIISEPRQATGPHIAGLELVGLDAGGLGRVQLLDGIGDFEIEHLRPIS